MIGTTSTEAKAAKAREAGANEVILYSQKDFVEEVNRITDEKGVNVIYDGVGKTTFLKSKNLSGTKKTALSVLDFISQGLLEFLFSIYVICSTVRIVLVL